MLVCFNCGEKNKFKQWGTSRGSCYYSEKRLVLLSATEQHQNTIDWDDWETDNAEEDEDAIYEVVMEDIVRGPGHDVKNGSGEVKNSTPPNSGDIEGQKADKDKEITGDNLTGGFDDDGENGTGDAHATHIMSANGKTGPESKPNVSTSKPAEENVNGTGYNADTIMNESDEEEEEVEIIDDIENDGDKDEVDEQIRITDTMKRHPGAKYQPKPEGHGQLKTETIKKYNAILSEAKRLKAENDAFKATLSKFRTTLQETVVYNSNLTYVTKLFTEHSTTKSEKENIMNRFDKEVSTVKESKKLYKVINAEMGNKKPLTESVDKTINSSVKSNSTLTESTVYADPSTAAIRDLINRVENK